MINFNYIGKIKLNNTKNIVNKLSQKEWESFDFRQKTFKVHRHTETIPIIYNEDGRETDLHYWPCYKKFQSLFKKIENNLSKHFSKGYIVFIQTFTSYSCLSSSNGQTKSTTA